MSDAVLAILALLPLVVALVLLVGLRWPAERAMPLAWATCVATGFLGWDLPFLRMAALTIQGCIIALGLLIIIFGSTLVLYTLENSGAMNAISQGLQRISPDKRIQAILIGFLFASFIEGAAGFGTSVALAAPLLLGLGFPALPAILICLGFNSLPACFGAIGTPIIIGFGALGPQIKSLANSISGMNPDSIYASLESFLKIIGEWSSLLQAPLAFIMPFFALCCLTRFWDKEGSWLYGLKAWKFCLFAPTCFLVPYFFFTWTLGPEFPALLGGLIGLGVVIWGVKMGISLPKSTWPPVSHKKWKDMQAAEKRLHLSKNFIPKLEPEMSLFKAWLPYLVICSLLIISRIPELGIKSWLIAQKITWHNILGFRDINEGLAYLYAPGIFFILGALVAIPLHRMSSAQVKKAWLTSFAKLRAPAIALFFSIALVAIFRGSAVNGPNLAALTGASSGFFHTLPSMPMAVANLVADLAGATWPFFAPFAGAAGTFLSGSAAVSDLMLADFQWELAGALSLPRSVIEAEQAVGAGMGSMISIQNIVTACAVVGMAGKEGTILRRMALPFFLYGLIISCLGAALAAAVPASLF